MAVLESLLRRFGYLKMTRYGLALTGDGRVVDLSSGEVIGAPEPILPHALPAAFTPSFAPSPTVAVPPPIPTVQRASLARASSPIIAALPLAPPASDASIGPEQARAADGQQDEEEEAVWQARMAEARSRAERDLQADEEREWKALRANAEQRAEIDAAASCEREAAPAAAAVVPPPVAAAVVTPEPAESPKLPPAAAAVVPPPVAAAVVTPEPAESPTQADDQADDDFDDEDAQWLLVLAQAQASAADAAIARPTRTAKGTRPPAPGTAHRRPLPGLSPHPTATRPAGAPPPRRVGRRPPGRPPGVPSAPSKRGAGRPPGMLAPQFERVRAKLSS